MRNVPVNLSDFVLRVADAPEMKMRKGDDGQLEPSVDDNGEARYVIAVFAKRKGQKGEEIKITLPRDPGPGFDEGSVVELVSPAVSAYSFENEKGKTVSGISFAADGVKPVG